MPKSRPFLTVALAAFIAGTFAACSEDEAPPLPLPEGPPDLQVVSLDAPGAHTPVSDAGSAGCFAVGESNPKCSNPVAASGCGFVVVLKTDVNKQIPLELADGSQPRFWSFEPPLGCYGAPDCGYAVLLIDPKSERCAARPEAALREIAAGPVISVDYEKLRKGIAGSFGRKTLRVELWPGEGFPDKKHCHFAEIEVDFELTCGPTAPTDGGGPDGAGDGGLDGGGDASSPESGLRDASADAPGDASSDVGDVSVPDGTGVATDASDARPPSDGSADSG
jgi:hypothetical protein